MVTKNLVIMLKTYIDSINLWFSNDFVYENLVWALASLWIFLCNYVLSSMGLILNYIFRFHRKNEQLVAIAQAEQTNRKQFEDYAIDGSLEELVNLLFPRFDDFHTPIEEGIEGKTENSVLMEFNSVIQIFEERREGEIDCCVLKEKVYDMNENYSDKREGKTEGCVFMESVSDINKGVKKINEDETESFEKAQEETKGSVFMEEPMALSFTFRENYISQDVSDIVKKELSKHNLEKNHVQEEEERESVQEQRMFTSNSTSDISFQFSRSDTSGDGYLLHSDNYNSFPFDFESNRNTFQFPFDSESDGNECRSLKEIEDVEETQSSCDREVSHQSDVGVETLSNECKNEKKVSTCHGNEKNGDNMETNEETKLEVEKEYDEEEVDWDHDELVEQLKLELKNARQGGLATILEEDEERESSKVVQELKPLSIEEKMEYKDHTVEIQKVYRCYAEKIRRLDVLNYQAMHAIGLLQLKDPLKLILVPKSSTKHVKPLVTQNLWPRKAQNLTCDPMLKLVHELDRELELVYVGQVCLSWEILCWQHMKIHELKKYESQGTRRYNLVAGEFQLFQVLLQRFSENEPFQQQPRIQSYVKNRCVIRNLLQVPAIKDDNTKDKKKFKWSEEDAISSDRLAQIVMESMHVFWEFVKADKDYGNVFHKVSSQQNGNEVEEAEILDLLRDIQTQLHKKERKLKNILKSGNCIVRKFQKHHEEKIELDHEQLLAQVGLRLISRVISMKKLRKDQLVWCSEKLKRIHFLGRKIQVEPCFLFLPC